MLASPVDGLEPEHSRYQTRSREGLEIVAEEKNFTGAKILVVGGAGFVGSNLVRLLREQRPSRIVIVDNLLSADISNVPEGEDIDFRLGSIAEDSVLEK